jgi:uncharacterized membrane protein (UPF0136 family)
MNFSDSSISWPALTLQLYGFLLIIGGIFGFAKGKSRASLIAGIISAGLVFIASYMIVAELGTGFWLGVATSLGLAVFFFLRYRKTGSFMPAGMMAGVSLLVLLVLLITRFA